MGTISEKLSYLVDTKSAIKEAIINKGVDVSSSTSFRSYANAIDTIKAGRSGIGNGSWWDIRSIITEDPNLDLTIHRGGAMIVLIDDRHDSIILGIDTHKQCIRTSDGVFYDHKNLGAGWKLVNHTWDKTKDKPELNVNGNQTGVNTRYYIIYNFFEIFFYELPISGPSGSTDSPVLGVITTGYFRIATISATSIRHRSLVFMDGVTSSLFVGMIDYDNIFKGFTSLSYINSLTIGSSSSYDAKINEQFADCYALTAIQYYDISFLRRASDCVDVFRNCVNLRYVGYRPKSIKSSMGLVQPQNLSRRGILAYLNGLDTVGGSTSMTFGANNKAKMEAFIAAGDNEIINAKNVATANKWTF